MDYDPEQISYNDMLALFWEGHGPFSKTTGTQYKPVAFYQDEEQKQLAEASKAKLEASTGNQVHTEILPLKEFYRAEDYHQKYYLRKNRQLMAELETFYPTEKDFVDSTLAARLSAYSAKHGFAKVLESELDSYGLSDVNTAILLKLAPELDEGAGGAACGIVE